MVRRKKSRLRNFVIPAVAGTIYASSEYFVNKYLYRKSIEEATRLKYKKKLKEKDQENELDDPKDFLNSQEIIRQNQLSQTSYGNEFNHTTKIARIRSMDGLELVSKFREQQEPTHKWVIIIHGYSSNANRMMSYAGYYFEHGYNILTPYNRAHGLSQGNYVGMGFLDRFDIENWINWILERDSQAQIVLHGRSMGAATAMMVAGDNISAVTSCIEDCGYTSAWDYFSNRLEREGFPKALVMRQFNILTKAKLGYSLKEAAPLEAVSHTRIPILVIHGGLDQEVPTEMTYRLYENISSEKEIYIVAQAGHGDSKDYDVEAYWGKVFDFIENHHRK
ncbi:MAG: alpha/beta hydrolase [Finegoldia sp.]|nr:alpha/beta hydrolase [Finegoldia sp.]